MDAEGAKEISESLMQNKSLLELDLRIFKIINI